MKVLVIDAAAAVRSRLVALLGEAGFFVVAESATAYDARTRVQTTLPDAIVLDVDLPDRSGLSLIADLRELAPHTFLLVLTNALSYRRRCMMLGAHAFLDKSTDFGDVARVIAANARSSTTVTYRPT